MNDGFKLAESEGDTQVMQHIGCIESDTLLDYVDEALSPEDLLRVGEHLAECGECAEREERTRRAAYALDHWTPRAHGIACRRDAATAPLVAALMTARESTRRGESDELKLAAATRRKVALDEALAQVLAVVGDETQSREIRIDVTRMPEVSQQGTLVIGLEIPQDIGESDQTFELHLVADGEVIGDPMPVSPACRYVASIALPDALQERWRNIEDRAPESWPFGFVLRARR